MRMSYTLSLCTRGGYIIHYACMQGLLACYTCACIGHVHADSISDLTCMCESPQRGYMGTWPQLLYTYTGEVAFASSSRPVHQFVRRGDVICIHVLADSLPSLTYWEYPSTDRGTPRTCRLLGRPVKGPRLPIHMDNFPKARQRASNLRHWRANDGWHHWTKWPEQ